MFCAEKLSSLWDSVLMPLLHAIVALCYCRDLSVPDAIYFVISKKWTALQIKARDNIHLAETASELAGILSLLL